MTSNATNSSRENEEDEEYRVAAERAIFLLFSSKRWVNRRVDSVSFPDLMTIVRRVSVDITISHQCQLPKLGGASILPIATIRKGSLVNFGSQDERGRAWSLLSLAETKKIEKRMLRAWAEACGVQPVHDWVGQVVDFDPDDPRRKNDPWETILEPSNFPAREEEANVRAFTCLVKMLLRDRIIFARLPARRRGVVYPLNRILKFVYERPMNLPSRSASVVLPDNPASGSGHPEWSGGSWGREKLVISSANAAFARNYHFQLTAPDNVAIANAALYDEQEKDVLSSPVLKATSRCDLYDRRDHEIRSGARVVVLLELAPVRRLWMNLAWTISLVGALFFVALALQWWWKVPLVVPIPGSGAAAGLLPDAPRSEQEIATSTAVVTFAGALVAAVVQVEDSNLARQLVWATRRRSLVCAGVIVAAVSAATVLRAFSPPPESQAMLWAIASIFSAAAFSLLVLTVHQLISWKRSVRPIEERSSYEDGKSKQKKLFRGKVLYYPRPLGPYDAGQENQPYEHEDFHKEGVSEEIRTAASQMGAVCSRCTQDCRDWWVF